MSVRITSLICFIAVLTFGSTTVFAQSWIIEQVFGGAANDRAFNLVSHANGNVTHLGYTNSFGNPATTPNVHLVHSDPLGNPIFETVYNIQVATGVVEPEMSIYECTNGDFVWTTGVHTAPGAPSDIIVVRVNAAGGVIWVQYLGMGNGANDLSTSVIETSIGEIYITGYTDAVPTAGNTDAIVAGFSAAGVPLFANKYGGNDIDLGRCIRELSTGDFVIAGESNSWTGGTWDGLQFAVAPGGALLWGGAYGSTTGAEGFSTVVENTNGDLYTSGIRWSGTNADSYIVRSAVGGGAQIQASVYNAVTGGQEGAWYVTTSQTLGNLVLTGEVPGIIGGAADGFFLEVGPAFGAAVNYRALGTAGNDELRAVEYNAGSAMPMTQDGYWMIGWTDGLTGNDDHCLLRTNLRGKTGCGQLSSVVETAVSGYTPITPSVNFYGPFAGGGLTVVNTFSVQNLCQGQYVAPNALKSGVNIPEEFTSETLFLNAEVLPQPVQIGGPLLVNTELSRAAEVQIVISDMQGRQVFASTVKAQAGENQFKLESEDLNSGAYVLQISAMGQSSSLPLMMID